MGAPGGSSGGKRGRNKPRQEPRLFDDGASRQRKAGQPKRRRGFFRWLFSLFFALAFWGTVAAGLAGAVLWYSLDQKGLFQIPEREPGIMVLANDGTEIAEQGTFFGDAVDLKELPSYVPNAIIAIEDRRFYSHYGVDPVGLARAMARNVLKGRLREGGSTLTQQLAKNLFLSQERTLTRKAQEAVFALWLESHFSKDEILQLYLNRVYFGGGANGIDKAARAFYGKSAYELTLMEAATLAGLLKAPTTYNPTRNPEDAKARAKLVLAAMVEEGYVTQDEADEALASPGSAAAASDYVPATQYAVDWINSQLPLLVKNAKQSLIIETTLDPSLQAEAELSLRKRLSENGKKLNVSQGAVVSMGPDGAIRALVGGRSYKRSQFNRATVAKRQPGSSFKPFVYLAAIENGYRPDSVEVDEPVRFGNWTPENYKRKYLGTVSLEQAYALSLNTVAAKLTSAVTPQAVSAVARRLGITSPLGQDLSLALGTSEVSLLEMTTAFTPFANGGRAVEPFIVKRILSRDGQVLYRHGGDGLGQVIGERELGEMNALMRGVVQYGTATKAKFGNFDIGGKTGTSQDYRDAWFIGYTPALVTGVWMGNDDNSPTKKVTGGSLPVLVWRDIMLKAHENLAPQRLPGEEVAPPEPPAVAEADVPLLEQQPQMVQSALPPEPRRRPGLIESLFGGSQSDTPRRKKRPWEERRDQGLE